MTSIDRRTLLAGSAALGFRQTASAVSNPARRLRPMQRCGQ